MGFYSGDGMSVTITDRGWPGHFICGHRCTFRRNTLIECGERRVVVSTVGNMLTRDESGREEIGHNRHYETMAFEAKREGSYWEADVCQQLDFDSDWCIEGVTEDSDLRAGEMHEAVVAEFVAKLEPPHD